MVRLGAVAQLLDFAAHLRILALRGIELFAGLERRGLRLFGLAHDLHPALAFGDVRGGERQLLGFERFHLEQDFRAASGRHAAALAVEGDCVFRAAQSLFDFGAVRVAP